MSVQMPSAKTLHESARLSLEHDKPLCYYFYNDSLQDNVCIASYQDDKILYKNSEEHTSPIVKVLKCETEFLVITENSIYIVSANIKIKR